MTALVCRGCSDALPDPLPWPGFVYCGRACRDQHADRIIAQKMAETARIKLPPPPHVRNTGGKRWCAECGDDLPADSKGRFCNATCRDEYRAAMESSA